MTECECCGASVSGGSAFTCTYCGGTFCPSHRLPFNHGCPNIGDWRNARPEKRKKARKTERKSGIIKNFRAVVAGAVILLFFLILVAWYVKLL